MSLARQTSLDFLTSYQAPLETSIKAIFDEFSEQIPEHSLDTQWALETLHEYALRPSKRIRGSLAAYTYDTATRQSQSRDGLRLGAALEFIQNHLLIIDDVMDRSSMRRGAATVHELHKNNFSSSAKTSDNAALIVGMLAQQVSSFALTYLEAAPATVLNVIQSLHRNVAITDIGQFDDMHQTVAEAPIPYNDVIRRYQQKSSYYSFVAPIESALLLAGKPADQSQRDARSVGIPAGVAFQLQDDYIGIFGDASKTGKHNLDDIHEGKYTMLMHYALQQANAADIRQLRSILTNQNAGGSELELVRNILKRSGAVEKVYDEMQRYAVDAKNAAHSAMSWNESYAKYVCTLIDFVVERAS